jgi:hypothetical protein
LSRNYESEKAKIAAKSSAAVVHPLLPNRPKEPVVQITPPKPTTAGVKSAGAKSGPVAMAVASDPLSGFLDPLSAMTISTPPPVVVDPLLNTSVAPIDDPLSSTNTAVRTTKAAESRIQNIEVSRQTAKAIHEDNLNTPWQNRKQQILKDYAYTGKSNRFSSRIPVTVMIGPMLCCAHDKFLFPPGPLYSVKFPHYFCLSFSINFNRQHHDQLQCHQ